MTTVYLNPLSTILTYLNSVGMILAGGKVNTYVAGTSTPQVTYTDSTGVTPNANPIILNAAGQLPSVTIWQPIGVKLKIVVTDASNVQVGPTFDQLGGINDPSFSPSSVYYAGNDTGAANAYILTVANAGFTSYVNGLVLYWIPANTNTGASTVNVNGIGIVNITNTDGSALQAGQINSGKLAVIVSQGGNFILTTLAVQTGSFLGTFTGFTTTVTATVQYRIYSNAVYLFFNTTNPSGTSNTTALTMTGMPAMLMPQQDRYVLCCTEDNGNAEQFSGLSISNAGVCVFQKYSISTGNFSSSGFTSSGTKGLPPDWNVSYPLS